MDHTHINASVQVVYVTFGNLGAFLGYPESLLPAQVCSNLVGVRCHVESCSVCTLSFEAYPVI